MTGFARIGDSRSFARSVVIVCFGGRNPDIRSRHRESPLMDPKRTLELVVERQFGEEPFVAHASAAVAATIDDSGAMARPSARTTMAGV